MSPEGLELTAEQAAATVEWAWPDAVSLVARAAGMATTTSEDYGTRFAQAVVLTIAADEGKVADDWAAEKLAWLATDVVPGLLVDLREARTMAARLDSVTLAQHLVGSMHWPGAPDRVLRALVALRPELADVIRRRAQSLGHHDPLEHRQPDHVDLADLDHDDPKDHSK